MLRYTLFGLIWLSKFTSAANNRCYLPNGTDINAVEYVGQDVFTPCLDYVGGQSMCCATWDQGCTADGLCLSADNQLWRVACTDPEWKSPACVKLALQQYPDAQAPMTQCSDGSYCVYQNATSTECCNGGNGLFIAANGDGTKTKPSVTRTIPSVAVTAAAASITSTALSIPTTNAATSTASSHSGLSNGAKTGIGLGVTLGVLIILGLLVGMLLMRRKVHKMRTDQNQYQQQPSSQGYYGADVKFPMDPMSAAQNPRPEELSSHQGHQVHQLDSGHDRGASPVEMEQPSTISRRPLPNNRNSFR